MYYNARIFSIDWPDVNFIVRNRHFSRAYGTVFGKKLIPPGTGRTCGLPNIASRDVQSYRRDQVYNNMVHYRERTRGIPGRRCCLELTITKHNETSVSVRCPRARVKARAKTIIALPASCFDSVLRISRNKPSARSFYMLSFDLYSAATSISPAHVRTDYARVSLPKRRLTPKNITTFMWRRCRIVGHCNLILIRQRVSRKSIEKLSLPAACDAYS